MGRGAGFRQTIERLRHDRFLRRLTLLSGGTLLGQLAVLLTAPLLTRLYSPDEFGLLGIFASLTGILGAAITLRYDFAIPLCATDSAAAHLVVVAMTATVGLTMLFGLAAWLFAPWLALVTDTPALPGTIWLLAVALITWGLAQSLSFWSIRRGAYRTNAANNVWRLVVQAAAPLGLSGMGGLGLVLGVVAGNVASFGHFLLTLPAGDRARLRAVRPRRIWLLARRHLQYPIFAAPSALLQNVGRSLPTMLMAVVYGPAAAGWFALAQRMLEVPVLLLARSASVVFLGELRGLEGAAVRGLFLRTLGRFLALGVLGMAPLLLLGPALFALIFGEEWRTAGTMVQCLVPAQLARFVAVPISQALNVYRRQDIHLLTGALNLGAIGLAFAFGSAFSWSPPATLILFSLGSALTYLVYLMLTWQIIQRKVELTGGLSRPSA